MGWVNGFGWGWVNGFGWGWVNGFGWGWVNEFGWGWVNGFGWGCLVEWFRMGWIGWVGRKDGWNGVIIKI